MNATQIKNTKRTMQEILETQLFLNWFGVFTEDGVLLKRPKQEDSCFYPDYDPDIDDAIVYYEKRKQSVVFPDFYLDNQIGIVSLLRNDKLEITITVLNINDNRNIKFIEAENLGQLLNKFPKLKQYIKKDVLKQLKDRFYHPCNY